MKIRADFRYSVSFLFLFAMLTANPSVAALPWKQGETKQTLAPMLKEILLGVVNISTVSRVPIQQNPLFNDPFFRRFFDIPAMPQEQEQQSLGSGVIVDKTKGYILTNNHVIAQADKITINLRDGRNFDAKVVGTDPAADLAVLKISAEKLIAVPLGNSDKMNVGDFVVAIGNPFGLGQTVTSGIVSALGRSGLGIEGYEDFIQTDASINPGNSGGALVNLEGKLIGINTAIVGPSGSNVGIGFAIPSNMVKTIMDQLIRHGEVRRGQLGVLIQNVTQELADALQLKHTNGAVIAQVLEGSPAEKAGLKVGDMVTAVNDEPVKNSAQLRIDIGLLSIGSTVTLKIVRGGKTRKVKVVIAAPKQTKTEASSINERLAGTNLNTIGAGHSLANRVEGVEVTSIDIDSRAAAAGLQQGDIIISVNRHPIKSLKDFRQAVLTSDNGLLLNILRGDGALFIVIS